jgi:hypothetical protein
MSKRETRLYRLLSIPADYTEKELDTIIAQLGCSKSNRGKTTGSAIAYIYPPTKEVLSFHSPHPDHVIKKVYLKKTIEFLKKNGLIDIKKDN